MGDYRSLPAWRRAVGLAHVLCAALEDAEPSEREAAHPLRRAALSIPSLVADAFLDSGPMEARDALAEAIAHLAEIRRFLGEGPAVPALPGVDRAVLVAEMETLASELKAASDEHALAGR